jgi:hypothetical protein
LLRFHLNCLTFDKLSIVIAFSLRRYRCDETPAQSSWFYPKVSILTRWGTVFKFISLTSSPQPWFLQRRSQKRLPCRACIRVNAVPEMFYPLIRFMANVKTTSELFLQAMFVSYQKSFTYAKYVRFFVSALFETFF